MHGQGYGMLDSNQILSPSYGHQELLLCKITILTDDNNSIKLSLYS